MLKYLFFSLASFFVSLAFAAPSKTATEALAILQQNIYQMQVVGFPSNVRATDFLNNMLSRGSYSGGCFVREDSRVEQCILSVEDYGIKGNIFRGRHSLYFSISQPGNQLASKDLYYLISSEQ